MRKGYGGFVFCVEAVLCGKGKVVENDRKAEFGTAVEDRLYMSGGLFRQ